MIKKYLNISLNNETNWMLWFFGNNQRYCKIIKKLNSLKTKLNIVCNYKLKISKKLYFFFKSVKQCKNYPYCFFFWLSSTHVCITRQSLSFLNTKLYFFGYTDQFSWTLEVNFHFPCMTVMVLHGLALW